MAASDEAMKTWHAPFARPATVVAPKPILKAGKLPTAARVADANGVFADPSLDAVVTAPRTSG